MKLLRVLNRQKCRRLSGTQLRRMAKFLIENLLDRSRYELGVHLIGADEMTRLNESFLGHAGSTDVITFDHRDTPDPGNLYGEIFISVDDAVTQAAQFGQTWQSEVVRYLAHGLLHLEGYDDLKPAARRIMKRQENKLVKELSRRFNPGKLVPVKNVDGKK
jgi:probable rRNA maturation factor